MNARARVTPFAALTVLSAAGLALTLVGPVDMGGDFLPADDPRRLSMILVRAGSFLMGSTEQEIETQHQEYGGARALYESEYPQRRLWLDDFYIDRTEVTQSQYKAFVDSTHRDAPSLDREWAALWSWKARAYPGALANHPVVLVTYDDAVSYCRWAGKFLPTEIEWEKAARGADGRSYPWGNVWDDSRLNSSSSWSDHPLSRIEIWTEWWTKDYHERLRGKQVTTLPVGSFPAGASPYGVLDMSGNVFEWTTSWYDAYSGSPYANSEFGTEYHVIRGGDWYLDPIYARAASRLRSPSDHRVPTIGFRCVCRESGVP